MVVSEAMPPLRRGGEAYLSLRTTKFFYGQVLSVVTKGGLTVGTRQKASIFLWLRYSSSWLCHYPGDVRDIQHLWRLF